MSHFFWNESVESYAVQNSLKKRQCSNKTLNSSKFRSMALRPARNGIGLIRRMDGLLTKSPIQKGMQPLRVALRPGCSKSHGAKQLAPCAMISTGPGLRHVPRVQTKHWVAAGCVCCPFSPPTRPGRSHRRAGAPIKMIPT